MHTTRQEVEQVVLDAVRSVAEVDPADALGLDSHLFDGAEVALDSIGAMELLCIIENELGGEIGENDLDSRQLVTVRDVVDLAMELGGLDAAGASSA